MRTLWALLITSLIYLLLIWVYFFYFKSIKITSKKPKDEHVIKIDIRDIPRYVKKIEKKREEPKVAEEVKPIVAKKMVVKKAVSTKKIAKKRAVNKRVVKKRVVKQKKVTPKKTIPVKITPTKISKPLSPSFESLPIAKIEPTYIPEIIEEIPIEEEVYQEPIIEEEIVSNESVEEEPIYEDEIFQELPPPLVPTLSPEIIVEEDILSTPNPTVSTPSVTPLVATPSNDIIAEEDMLFIPNPMISTPSTTASKKTESLSSLLGGGGGGSLSTSQKTPMIEKLYGGSFDSFTPIQKKFIVDNLGGIHRITQNTLTRRGYPAGAIAHRTGQEGENIVSFDLHPNGDISNLRLEKKVGYRALDDNTLQTIKIAYKDYPYPTETTHIVFYVEYSIFGY